MDRLCLTTSNENNVTSLSSLPFSPSPIPLGSRAHARAPLVGSDVCIHDIPLPTSPSQLKVSAGTLLTFPYDGHARSFQQLGLQPQFVIPNLFPVIRYGLSNNLWYVLYGVLDIPVSAHFALCFDWYLFSSVLIFFLKFFYSYSRMMAGKDSKRNDWGHVTNAFHHIMCVTSKVANQYFILY